MANKENGAIPPDSLNFIDRFEKKITSPDREMISPTKSPRQRSSVGEHDNDPKSTTHWSGLVWTGRDSSRKSSDSHLEDEGQTSFVDRQEKYTEAEETEKIVSPNKTVERLFDFLEPEMQSLDFANNNNGFADDYDDENDVENEFGTNGQLVELKITESATGDVYLGKEDGIDGCDEKDEPESKSFSSKSDSMNLYWYKDTMSLDPLELEAFKSSQTERVSTEITAGNLYYAAKNKQDIKESAQEKITGDVSHHKRTAEDSKREKWSPAFESASSRILHVATEMKSEPKAKGNDARGQGDIGFEKQHPWGLERDEKLKYKRKADELEDLPDLEDVIITDVYDKNIGMVDETLGLVGDFKVKSVLQVSSLKSFKDLKNESNEDEEDAVGYMELKDKPVVQEALSATEVRNVEMVQSAKAGIEMGKSDEMSMSICNNLESRTLSPKSMQKFSSQGTDKIDADVIESVEKHPVDTSTAGHIEEPFVYDPFTVKRTYKSSEKSEEMLQGINGVFIETETFVDEYLDDKCYSLILQDSWLRLRNKRFEMQVNASFGYGNSSTSNEILTNENDIKEMLMNMYSTELEQRRKVSESHIDVLIDSVGLMEFVTVVTTRKRYQVGNCMVLLEVSDKGQQVGEIEIIVNSPRAIPSGLDQMDALAFDIGFQPLQGR